MNGGVGIMREYADSTIDSPQVVAVEEGGFITDLWEDKDFWTVEVIGNRLENPELITKIDSIK